MHNVAVSARAFTYFAPGVVPGQGAGTSSIQDEKGPIAVLFTEEDASTFDLLLSCHLPGLKFGLNPQGM